ncbi:hypothetical protein RJ641_006513 [Dillenia turbinata]|uniref:Uncharacterized protein n=1 Tax=Dillenia turbinata TaxID=194707 RepID=A0AAN8VEN9_9MAGN
MATLQKFKLLATQCAVAGSPTPSPTTSPVIHLRRRKTLRMFLSRSGSGGVSRRLPRGDDSLEERQRISKESSSSSTSQKSKETVSSHKLKDLFVSSPPLEDRSSKNLGESGDSSERLTAESFRYNGGGRRSFRPMSAALRSRLLRRPWRPVLVTIPE